MKTLTNTGFNSFFKGCGHVMCSPCVEKARSHLRLLCPTCSLFPPLTFTPSVTALRVSCGASALRCARSVSRKARRSTARRCAVPQAAKAATYGVVLCVYLWPYCVRVRAAPCAIRCEHRVLWHSVNSQCSVCDSRLAAEDWTANESQACLPDGRCFVCNAKVDRRDVVQMQAGGTAPPDRAVCLFLITVACTVGVHLAR
jgi:hypothetical protein